MIRDVPVELGRQGRESGCKQRQEREDSNGERCGVEGTDHGVTVHVVPAVPFIQYPMPGVRFVRLPVPPWTKYRR